jgi:hypothetical protein
MKANELRIGNLIKFSEDGTIFTVGSIEEKGFSVQNDEETTWIEAEEFEPIPLTEEWLLKFGFHKKDAEWYLHPCFELKIIVFNKGEFNGVMFYTRNIHTDFTPIYSTTHMNHVHQLQNLYFALTGEELTYGGNK